jgi:GNAT superfamily N-acetyltransferase
MRLPKVPNPLDAYVRYTKAFGEYTGATQMGRDAAWAVRHPIARMQNKGPFNVPERMEVPFGPGRALRGLHFPAKTVPVGDEGMVLERASRRGDNVLNIAGQKMEVGKHIDDEQRRKLARKFAGDYLSNVSPEARRSALRMARNEQGVPVHYNLKNARGGRSGSISMSLHPQKVYVHGVWVDPTQRNTRAGLHLIDEAIKTAKKAGHNTIDGHIVESTGKLAALARKRAARKGVKWVGADTQPGDLRGMIELLNQQAGHGYRGSH